MRVLLLIATFVMSTAATAEAEFTPENFCVKLSEFSMEIMDFRQDGTPMSEMIALVDRGHPSARNLGRDIVVDAYKEPRHTTPTAVKHAIEEFGNKTYMKCFNLLPKSR